MTKAMFKSVFESLIPVCLAFFLGSKPFTQWGIVEVLAVIGIVSCVVRSVATDMLSDERGKLIEELFDRTDFSKQRNG